MSNQSIDINVILRFITRDVPALYDKAFQLLAQTEVDFVVDDIAISETVYVLSHNPYKYSRENIVKHLLVFFEIPNILIQNRQFMEDVLEFYAEHPALSFNDCYLAIKANLSGNDPLWTFDRKLANQIATVELV